MKADDYAANAGTSTAIDYSPGQQRQAAPLFTITSGRGWRSFELRELWARRDLLSLLAWREIKVRYQQTTLGIAWAILQPFLTMVVFTIFFGRLARIPSEGQPYAIFSYAGLLPWNYFNTAVSNSGNSLVGNANLITKVYFPRLVIPGAAVAAALVEFVVMACYGVGFTTSLLMFPVLTIIVTIIAAGVGMWTSALNVKYRDVRYALPFTLQIMMFLTPIIYPVSIVPARWRWLLILNPLSGAIEGYRSAIFGRPFDWTSIAISAAISVALLVFAAWVFRRMEAEFADVI
jgi:lipopolysaccharide transport system permease protein